MAGHCHELIAKTAQDMARAVYEELAKRNDWYALNPDMETWIKAKWGLYITEARSTLAGMLNTHISETLKEQIADALVKDNSLQRGRSNNLQLVRHKP